MANIFPSCFILFTMMTLWSCEKDDTNSNNNNNTGDPRGAFVGTWVCDEESQLFGNNTYSVDINMHSSITNRIVIDNFYNLGFQESHAQVDVSGNNMTIFFQNINGFDVSGSGVLATNKINLTYTADDGAGPDHVTATYTKTN